MKLAELAAALALPFEGDGDTALSGLASLDDAGPAELSFVTGPKYADAFAASRAGAFILPAGFDAHGRACLRSPAPYADFARAVRVFHPRAPAPPGVHPSAVVAPDAVLGPGVSVGALSVIGAGARIGARARIHAHVTVYEQVEIGEDAEIHSGAQLREGVRIGARAVINNGAVIGAPGFGFASRADGTRLRVPHVCPVEIGDDCEIGANTTIDASHPGHPRRGHAETRTRLGRDVIVDNLTQIGHGCEIGDHSALCAQVGLAGSTVVGHHVFMGGKSAAGGHLSIGPGSLVGGMCGVTSDLEPGSQVHGFPATERRLWARMMAALRRLPELLVRVRKLEQHVGLGRGDERA